jgi:hypothetical protein
LKWAVSGFRRRAIIQRTADNAKIPDLAHWIETGEIRDDSRPPPEEDPAVKIAAEQIRKDGRLIVENVTEAIEKWREQQTLKPAEPT